MPNDVTVVALVAAHNEEDVIAAAIGDLVDQGIGVVLLDDASTDRTVAEAERFLGRGLLRIERLAEADPAAPHRFSLRRLLARKQTLAAEIRAVLAGLRDHLRGRYGSRS